MAEENLEDGLTESPKKGPTLSTSTSSFEALDPHDPNLSRLATTMFQKTGDYLLGEITVTQSQPSTSTATPRYFQGARGELIETEGGPDFPNATPLTREEHRERLTAMHDSTRGPQERWIYTSRTFIGGRQATVQSFEGYVVSPDDNAVSSPPKDILGIDLSGSSTLPRLGNSNTPQPEFVNDPFEDVHGQDQFEMFLLSQEDYKLLEAMNQATVTKYADMRQIACNVGRTMSELNDKYKSLQPYLDQIDHIEDSVIKLEQAAYKLDAYSKRLEAKFKSLEKR